MNDTTQHFFGNTFNNCLLNASGCKCTEKQELDELNSSESGGIVSKTCSLEHRTGNQHPRYYESNGVLWPGRGGVLTINSMGLPNNGYRYYTDFIDTYDKPYIISVAGNYLLAETK